MAAFFVVLGDALAAGADLGAQPAAAPVFASLPAVDGLNGKAEFFGGATNFYNYDIYNPTTFNPPFSYRSAWRGDGGGLGTVTFPLQHDFGVQVDSILAEWNNRFLGGGGAHLFWRDPSQGLIGVYGSGTYWSGANGVGIGRAAGELEGYIGRITVQGVVGGEFGGRSAVASSAFGVSPFGNAYLGFNWYDLHTRIYDHASIAYYLTDDIKLSVGHIYTGGRSAATVGGEMRLPVSFYRGAAATAFVEGRIGEHNADSIQGGLRIYFGNSDKTLIRRQREDDPTNYLKDNLFTLSNSQRTGAILLPKSSSPSPPPYYCCYY
ncbi:MAG TPA: hypothetical protein VEH76_03585 [Methylocystis sp.]|nr:hypothetical protein [Methylocystis sp.]